MAQTNLGGLAGAAIGGLVGYGMTTALAKSGQPPLAAIAWGGAAGCFAASMFGLMYDRSVVPELRKSYKVLTRHFTRGERSGPDYDPRERVAMFGIPVAFATFIVPVVAGLLWIIAWNAARRGGVEIGMLSLRWFATYFVAGIGAVALTMIIGRATAEHRLLEREIAFNTTPLAEVEQQSAPIISAPDAPPTEEELTRLRTKGRRDAVIVIVVGALLLAIHHWFALQDGRYYPKVAFGAPMIMMVGLFGLFEPRIMTRHLPVGKHYPVTVLLLMLLAMVIGGAIGWQVDAWYHG